MKQKSEKNKEESLYYIAFELVSYAVSISFLVYFLLVTHKVLVLQVAFLSLLLETAVVFIIGCIKYKEFLTFYTPHEELKNSEELLEKIYFSTQVAVIAIIIICKIIGF